LSAKYSQRNDLSPQNCLPIVFYLKLEQSVRLFRSSCSLQAVVMSSPNFNVRRPALSHRPSAPDKSRLIFEYYSTCMGRDLKRQTTLTGSNMFLFFPICFCSFQYVSVLSNMFLFFPICFCSFQYC